MYYFHFYRWETEKFSNVLRNTQQRRDLGRDYTSMPEFQSHTLSAITMCFYWASVSWSVKWGVLRDYLFKRFNKPTVLNIGFIASFM